jgi:hypothetical protein
MIVLVLMADMPQVKAECSERAFTVITSLGQA